MANAFVVYTDVPGNLITRRVVAELPTFEAAEAFVRSTYKLVCFEADPDVPGAADSFTTSGNIISIEPRA